MATSTNLPRISLITPVCNSVKFIEQTICSVLAQNYPNLEYFIIDGGSTDGTLEVVRKFESQITGWISERDNGMYDALNKGFARSSGEIMGWISATDKLHLGGLAVVGSVFSNFPKVEWITGRRTVFSEEGNLKRVDPIIRWSRYSFLLGASQRHIQQESTYWRRSLWDRTGGYVDASRRSASDFELWVRFFRFSRLHTVDALIGGFREHSDSDSLSNLKRFNEMCDSIAETELRQELGILFAKYKHLDSFLGRTPPIGKAWNMVKRTVIRGIYGLPSPVIEKKGGVWRMRLACTQP